MLKQTLPQSLIPYLDPSRTHFCLKISLPSDDLTGHETPGTPFLTLSESDPLTRLFDAKIVTDAGSKIKRVFLLVQKDEYHLARDELWPINNRDIDQCWQRAFSLYSKESQDASVVILGDQVGKDGALLPLQSLFYCKRKQIFFHPPCPKCGSPLQQCYDDDLLTELGFEPYSTSLKRYLFCPSCFGSGGNSDFWMTSLKTSDARRLKDQWHLIKDFGRLTEDKSCGNQFPCPNCDDHQACYGVESLAVSRIAPFSFYPFFMLIFEAASVNALDFLSLISGSSFEDLEAYLAQKKQIGRMTCLKALRQNGPVKPPFLFNGDEKPFLEVLYLKLSFLEELARTIFAGMDFHKHPDLGLSVDKIWVELPHHSGLLPFFWNFKLRLIDMGIGQIPAKSPLVPRLPPSYTLHFLGIVWFHALLVNKEQSVSKIHLGLREAIDSLGSDGHDKFESYLGLCANNTFAPENIFWMPKEKKVSKAWQRLWEKSLDLGWSLLRVGLSVDSGWTRDAFCEDLENLRKEIRDSLFQRGATVTEEASAPEDRAIHEILLKIMEKWRMDDGAEQDELEETLLVDSKTDQERFHETVISSGYKEDLAPETIIVSPGDFKKEVQPPIHTEEDDIPETVIFTPADDSKGQSGSSRKSPLKDVGFEEKQGTPEQEPAEPLHAKKRADEPDEDDFLEATVILPSDKGGDKG